VTYSFGRTPNPAASFVEEIGSFDEAQPASVVDGLQKSGVNVQRLRTGGFKCGSLSPDTGLHRSAAAIGVLGKVADTVFARNLNVLTRVSGQINYSWTDSAGASQERQSPIFLEVPLLEFKIPDARRMRSSRAGRTRLEAAAALRSIARTTAIAARLQRQPWRHVRTDALGSP
jgi:hypothetical protein